METLQQRVRRAVAVLERRVRLAATPSAAAGDRGPADPSHRAGQIANGNERFLRPFSWPKGFEIFAHLLTLFFSLRFSREPEARKRRRRRARARTAASTTSSCRRDHIGYAQHRARTRPVFRVPYCFCTKFCSRYDLFYFILFCTTIVVVTFASNDGVPDLRLRRLRGARDVRVRRAPALDPPDVLVERAVHVHVGETEQHGHAQALWKKIQKKIIKKKRI